MQTLKFDHSCKHTFISLLCVNRSFIWKQITDYTNKHKTKGFRDLIVTQDTESLVVVRSNHKYWNFSLHKNVQENTKCNKRKKI